MLFARAPHFAALLLLAITVMLIEVNQITRAPSACRIWGAIVWQHDPESVQAGRQTTSQTFGPASHMFPPSRRLRQDELARKVGGVVYRGRPKYALVEALGKKIIVKINDVGPPTPGRIIDLNERAIRYFDPSMEVGGIRDVLVRPLQGTSIEGPVSCM